MTEDKESDKELSRYRKRVIQELHREEAKNYKTSSNQLNAVRRYRKRHSSPSLEGYMRIRRQAYTFVKPKEGTRAEDYIKEKGDQYYKDLLELNQMLKRRIKELHLNIREENNHEEDK